MREHWEEEPTSEGWEYRRDYFNLLHRSLAVAFRHTCFNSASPTIHTFHTRNHEWMFDKVFINAYGGMFTYDHMFADGEKFADDEKFADAVCMWAADRQVTPPGSCTRRLLELTERGWPFSPRLRCTVIHAVQHLWPWELEAAGLELVSLLNNLEVGVREINGAKRSRNWAALLKGVLSSPMGQWFLSSHYWLLLRNLISMGYPSWEVVDRQTEIMKSLEEAQDWEKLETWMLVVWCSVYLSHPDPTLIQDIGWATLTLFRQRPSAIPRFEDLYEQRTRLHSLDPLFNTCANEFRSICDQVRVEQSCLEPPS
jgi:hypothetical protein